MALYKHGTNFTKVNHPAFDAIHLPGQAVPFSGIYRCVVCGYEVASNEGQPLPTQSHAVHNARMQPIRWRLVAMAFHKAA